MRFRVIGNLYGLVDICLIINIDMADTMQMFDNRYAGFLHHPLYQTFATARNDDIDILIHGQQLADGCTIRGVNYLNERFRQACRLQPLPETGCQRQIGVQGLRTTSENTGIARFQAQ
ncbi:hypothetical protein BMS3Bbin11_01004 [bacterium BMS3Bbin11]|nr:hypothetical protein BMS3Bbin11_01004 [bacterium BMS3Bbin11]